MYTIFSFWTPSFKGKKVSKTCKIQRIEFFLKALKLKQVIEFDGCHTHFYLNLVGLDAMLTITQPEGSQAPRHLTLEWCTTGNATLSWHWWWRPHGRFYGINWCLRVPQNFLSVLCSGSETDHVFFSFHGEHISLSLFLEQNGEHISLCPLYTHVN
jgi:hypothetical protein